MGILNIPRILLLAMLMGAFLQGSAAAYKITPAEPLFTLTRDFLQPSDVAVGKQGRIYVLDGVRHRVVVFNSEGVFLSSFGSLGSSKGQLRYPLGIEVDGSGTIYIADTGNRRIQVFSPDGDYKADFAVATDLPGQKCDPVDVAFDESVLPVIQELAGSSPPAAAYVQKKHNARSFSEDALSILYCRHYP